MAYKHRLRLILLLVLFFGALIFFCIRLYGLQIMNVEQTTSGSGTFTYDTRVRAARGEILDRNGNVLVSNRASYDLIITNYALFNAPDPNESLRQLVALGKRKKSRDSGSWLRAALSPRRARRYACYGGLLLGMYVLTHFIYYAVPGLICVSLAAACRCAGGEKEAL